jgi:hypothetical protein
MWSTLEFLILKKKHWLRVFENRVRRKMFEPNEELTGDWRKLRNEELHDSHPSTSIIMLIKSRTRKWVGHVERMGKHANKCLVGEPEGEGTLGRPRRGWDYNITTDFKELRRMCGLDSPGSEQSELRAVVNAVMTFRFPLNETNLLAS